MAVSSPSSRSPFIRGRKHAAPTPAVRAHTTGVAAAALMALGTPALAQTGAGPAPAGEVVLPSVRVEAERDEGWLPPVNAPSPKFTAPLLDTPKTVQVIPQEVIRETGATTLQEILRSSPGITFGNAEGGNPMGDQPFIRGMDAQSSTFVDGMRDIGAGSREAFNIESVQVIKGADSAFAGRGGAGGSIDIITKKAKNQNFFNGDLGLGSASYKRGTIDLNRVMGEGTAVRLNAMAHDADIPGRDGPTARRWGLAPTVSFGMGTPTEVSLSWQHLQTHNMPDGGVPWQYSNTAAAGLPGGTLIRPTYGNSRDNWYGLTSRDNEREKSDMLTGTIEHKFSADNKFRNSFRYTRSAQDYAWTQPDDSRGNVLRGFVWRRGNLRDADVRTVQNVSEFTGKARTGSLEHSFSTGLELSHEKSDVYSTTYSNAATANCTSASAWCATLDNPDGSVPWNVPYSFPASPVRNRIQTAALYGFDTVKFNDQWLLNGGLRLDHYRIHAVSQSGTTPYDQSRNDTLLNYQLGLVYKPAPNGSIYANIGSASRPGGATLGNGSEDLAITTDALAQLKPEKTRSMELGTKWDLVDQRLAVTAALFRNEVTNVRITENGITYMGGDKVVNGVEFGLSGTLAPGLSLFGGYTYMDSKQKNVGAGSAANGQPYMNTPKHSLSLWTSYKPAPAWTLGLGVYAQSSVNQGYVRSSVDGGVVTKQVPGYARFDAMLAYRFTRQLALQLNVYNLTNKVYYSGVRSPHYASIAPGRSAVATLNFSY